MSEVLKWKKRCEKRTQKKRKGNVRNENEMREAKKKKIVDEKLPKRKLLFNNATRFILDYYNMKYMYYPICVTVSGLVGHGSI